MGQAATSTEFGFDFQTNAAIFIMLKNIQRMETIRLEGKEDIQLEMSEGGNIYAQAKAIERPSEDFVNVTTKLKEALKSLSNTSATCGKRHSFVYVTNTPKPFGLRDKSNLFSGLPTRRSYAELPTDLQKKVNTILKDIKSSIDTSKLVFQTIPFETEDDSERYKFIIEEIREFLSQIPEIQISKQRLHEVWSVHVFRSGTKRTQPLKLKKKDVVWPIIVLTLQNGISVESDDYDDSENAEIKRLYESIINTCSEKYEFVTKIISAYNQFKWEGMRRDKIHQFVEKKYSDFYNIFDGEDVDEVLRDILLKIIIRKILYDRIKIDSIKNVANL